MLEPTYHFVKYCIRNILFIHLQVPNLQISQFAAAGMRLISRQSAGAMPEDAAVPDGGALRDLQIARFSQAQPRMAGTGSKCCTGRYVNIMHDYILMDLFD